MNRDADTPYWRAALLDRANGSGALSTSGFSSARAGKPDALRAPSCCYGKASVLAIACSVFIKMVRCCCFLC